MPGLRYDLTVPLARVVAEYRNDLPRYFKRYQIQPVYRADRPAAGRFREFYQCDVDIVGSANQTVEAEVLAAGAQVLLELGFGSAEHPFALRLNHRGVLRALMEAAGVPTDAGGLGAGRHRQTGQDRAGRCARRTQRARAGRRPRPPNCSTRWLPHPDTQHYDCSPG